MVIQNGFSFLLCLITSFATIIENCKANCYKRTVSFLYFHRFNHWVHYSHLLMFHFISLLDTSNSYDIWHCLIFCLYRSTLAVVFFILYTRVYCLISRFCFASFFIGDFICLFLVLFDLGATLFIYLSVIFYKYLFMLYIINLHHLRQVFQFIWQSMHLLHCPYLTFLLFQTWFFHQWYSVAFYLRSVTHFQLLYVKGLSLCPDSFFFFAGRCPVVPGPFIERIVFAPLYCLCTFANQLSLFLVFYSVFLIHFVDMKLRYCRTL